MFARLFTHVCDELITGSKSSWFCERACPNTGKYGACHRSSRHNSTIFVVDGPALDERLRCLLDDVWINSWRALVYHTLAGEQGCCQIESTLYAPTPSLVLSATSNELVVDSSRTRSGITRELNILSIAKLGWCRRKPAYESFIIIPHAGFYLLAQPTTTRSCAP